jgi:pSer/pThr/pTyr-binding forkhead associated (FHA) protein
VEEYVELSIDVFDVTGQRAKVRRTLTVRGLIDEILREFDDLDRRTPDVYGIFMKGASKPVSRDQTMIQLDLQNQDELVFKYLRQSVRKKIVGAPAAYLREESSDRLYDILWQQAIIGRPDADPVHSELLAVNLETYPNGQRVSRRHAQIVEEGGHYYVESLSPSNPTFLNNETIPIAERRLLRNGDRIRIGHNLFTLTFLIKSYPAGMPPAPVQAAAVAPPPVRPITARVEEVPLEPTTPLAQVSNGKAAPASPPAPATLAGTSMPPARLRVRTSIDAASQGKTVEIVQTPFTMGRENCDLSLRGDRKVSRTHASIMYDFTSGIFYLTDLESSNGTWLDGNRLPPNTPRELNPGALISLGPDSIIMFEAG